MRHILVSLLLLAGALPASADWEALKGFLKPEVRIEEETEERLVVRSDAFERAIVITLERQADSDLYGDVALRRGDAPYRIWVASEGFWNDETRPRRRWGQVFHARFLRLVREPRRDVAR